jgi:hypothetical protein
LPITNFAAEKVEQGTKLSRRMVYHFAIFSEQQALLKSKGALLRCIVIKYLSRVRAVTRSESEAREKDREASAKRNCKECNKSEVSSFHYIQQCANTSRGTAKLSARRRDCFLIEQSEEFFNTSMESASRFSVLMAPMAAAAHGGNDTRV